MAASIAFLRDLRPYKSSWRVQVKVLHSWRQFTPKSGETLECILANSMGTKIHASVKKDLVLRFANQLTQGQWRFIESFSLTHASGQYRPTAHVYKMNLLNSSNVRVSDRVSESQFLSLARFSKIHNDEVNPSILVDVIGQVINIGEVEDVETQNKPVKKLDIELRDEHDDRLTVTLWGKYAQQVFVACEEAYVSSRVVVLVVRFAKIKSFKDMRSVSNSFDASQITVNPNFPEVEAFVRQLPSDGLSVCFRQSKPKRDALMVKEPDYLEFDTITIQQLKGSSEVGRVKIICSIYAIDTDWSWYYFSCKKCNKKVAHVHTENLREANVSTSKVRKFWCDTCRVVVNNVLARYKLHIKVVDSTSQTKLMLFDSAATDIVSESATALLGGSLDEIVDPESLPNQLINLKGKTYVFLVSVEKENLWNGLDTYKVFKVLSKHGMLQEEHVLDESDNNVNPDSIVDYDQDTSKISSQSAFEEGTPLSKRVLEIQDVSDEQCSATKKLCLDDADLEMNVIKHGDAFDDAKISTNKAFNDVIMKIEAGQKK